MKLNIKSLVISLIVAFIAVFATNFVIHQLWLGDFYKATASLWRTESEMQQHFGWMLLGQFLIAAAFTLTYAGCVAPLRCPSCTFKYGACMAAFASGGHLVMYTVQPYPGAMVAKWCLAALVQFVLVAFLVYKVYTPPAQAVN